MKRSAMAMLAAISLIPMAGGGVVRAAPPAPPQIVQVAAQWGMRDWSDGTTRCTLIMDGWLDPGFTRGSPVFAHAHVHVMWVGAGGGTWQDFNYANLRVERGATRLHTYTSFMDDGTGGYYVVDRVWYELTSTRGATLSSMAIDTVNTCMNR